MNAGKLWVILSGSQANCVALVCFFASYYVNISFFFVSLLTCIGDGSVITVTVNVFTL